VKDELAEQKTKVELSKKLLTNAIYEGDDFKLVLSVRYDKIVEIEKDIWYEILEIGSHYDAVTDTDAVLLDYIDTKDYKELVIEEFELTDGIELVNKALNLIEKWKNEGYYMVEEVQ